MSSFLLIAFQPLRDFFFAPCPLPHRWRLLLLQPIALLTYTIKALPYISSRPFVICYIPTRRSGESVRALVYNHPVKRSESPATTKKRPLHIDIHGGAFIGGIPEYDASFCNQLARSTGAVVVSITYRFAPRFPFPAAHDDVDDVFAWLLEHAEEEFDADPRLLTVSGFSAGGNLALAGSLNVKDQTGESRVLGAVTFYNPVSLPTSLMAQSVYAFTAHMVTFAQVDLRLPPWDKRKPPDWPSFDLLWFLLPLFDAYAGPNRIKHIKDKRMSPTLAPLNELPKEMLFIIPTIDFLFYEQMEMVEKLENEIKETKAERRVDALVFERQIHGWLECE